MKKWGWVISMLALVLLLAVGCGKESEEEAAADRDKKKSEEKESEESETELGDFNISFTGEVKEEEDRFIIDGESNLLPDARIIGEVVVDDGETVFSDTSELIAEDGTFHIELDHHKYGDGEIIIRFEFEGMQEDAIKRHYGEKGQNLEGPFVYKDTDSFEDNVRKAEVRIPYLAGESNDLAIKAVEWEEKPDDYGDPRVWIEAEEVTEDGEFFYIKGKSNMMEGALLKVKYANNRGEARVMPDGTFDFKFDYEYLENQEIEIIFEPFDFMQPNDVHETYGKNGQKLVGNLVATQDYSSNQYILKVVDWDESGAGKDNSQDGEETNDEEDEEQDQNDMDDKDED